jgi:hypothetical protein
MLESPLVKLTRLCNSISSDPQILSELKAEVEASVSDKVITSMIKKSLKQTDLAGIGMIDEVLPLCFQAGTITEIDLYGSSSLGIKCFFMSSGTYFPLHDHPNELVATAVLYGNVKYLLLDKTSDPSKMSLSKKAPGKPGDVMFNTLKYRNVHSILALEDSVILDIFMHQVNEPGNFFRIKKFDRDLKEFTVEKDNHVFFLTRSWKMMGCDCSK